MGTKILILTPVTKRYSKQEFTIKSSKKLALLTAMVSSASLFCCLALTKSKIDKKCKEVCKKELHAITIFNCLQ